MPRFHTVSLPLALTATVLLTGCNSTAPDACSSVFVAAPVVLVDGTGAPVTPVAVTSVLARTGDTLLTGHEVQSPQGRYVILTDDAIDALYRSGDTVHVTFSQSGADLLTAIYAFDVPGGCHIRQIAGQDTLVSP